MDIDVGGDSRRRPPAEIRQAPVQVGRRGQPCGPPADDAERTIAGKSMASRTYPTKEAFMRCVIRPFNARMRTRLIPTVRRLYAEGDTVIAFAFFDSIAFDAFRSRVSPAAD